MKYAIINTTDRPYRRHVVEVVNGKAYYMCRDEEPFLKDHDGMELRPSTTSLEDFGFEITESEDKVNFVKKRPSVAQYKDGMTRPWQGEEEFTLSKVQL